MTDGERHAPEALGPNAYGRYWLQIVIVSVLALPAPVLRTLEVANLPHPHLESWVESIIFGISIFAAATLLVWGSEVAERMISAALALAILAIIAVLPEYAVDIYFAWTAPDNPENANFALANMTGANRLLIGLAWPAVFFLFYLRTRSRDLAVGQQNSMGLVFLAAATIYSFSIPIRSHLSLIDSGIMIGLFAVYLYLSSRAPPSEHELVGPALAIDALPGRWRWTAVIAIFAFAAGTVFAAAEPFAEGLVDTGESLGVDEFLLVQWVAPLASEAPEFILAAFLALRGRAAAGMTLLISSKVNQWTLLVGSLPLAYSVSGQTLDPLPMESRQAHEVFLTAGQSLFAVAVLTTLSFSFIEATLIFGLFSAQFLIPIDAVRVGFGVAYCVLAILWLLKDRRSIGPLLHWARLAMSPPTGRWPPPGAT